MKKQNKDAKAYDSKKRDYPNKDRKCDRVKRAENDISWYMQDSTLVEAAGKLNFNNPLGNYFDRTGLGENIYPAGVEYDIQRGAMSARGESLPGIAVLSCTPFYGVAEDSNAPINIAARAMFGRIRSTLSTSNLGVDAADMMQYMIAMDNLFSYYGFLARVYGLASSYGALNKYLGKALVQSCGVSYDDVVTNYGKLRYYIKLFAQKVNTALRMPKGYGVVERHFWLFSNVFKDGEAEKSGLYIHVPNAFYRYKGVNGENPPVCEHVTFQSDLDIHNAMNEYVSGKTVDELIAFGDGLLNRLLTDDDIANISGLMLRTFGSEGCYTIVDMSDDYSVIPVYSKEILEQIHNTTFIGVDTSSVGVGRDKWAFEGGNNGNYTLDYRQKADLTSSDPYLQCTPVWIPNPTWSEETSTFQTYRVWGQAFGGGIDKVMDSRESVPSAEVVMLDSRGMAYTGVMVGNAGDINRVVLLTAGLELYSRILVKLNRRWSSTYSPITSGWLIPDFSELQREDLITMSNMLGGATIDTYLGSVFDWFPRISTYHSNAEIDPDLGSGVVEVYQDNDVYEYNNYTKVDRDTLMKLHEAALMGAFSIPIEAKAWNK